jgi:hypothetical protein
LISTSSSKWALRPIEESFTLGFTGIQVLFTNSYVLPFKLNIPLLQVQGRNLVRVKPSCPTVKCPNLGSKPHLVLWAVMETLESLHCWIIKDYPFACTR